MIGPVEDLCNSGFHMVVEQSETSQTLSKYLLAGGSRCYNTCSESEIVTKSGERLLFSQYLVNPNKFKFNKIVRIMALKQPRHG